MSLRRPYKDPPGKNGARNRRRCRERNARRRLARRDGALHANGARRVKVPKRDLRGFDEGPEKLPAGSVIFRLLPFFAEARRRQEWVKNGLPSKHNSMAASHSTAEVSGGLLASSKEQGGVTGADRMNGTRNGSAAIAAPSVLSFFCFVQGPWALNEAAPPSA
jgi:hypothetical protein